MCNQVENGAVERHTHSFLKVMRLSDNLKQLESRSIKVKVRFMPCLSFEDTGFHPEFYRDKNIRFLFWLFNRL